MAQESDASNLSQKAKHNPGQMIGEMAHSKLASVPVQLARDVHVHLGPEADRSDLPPKHNFRPQAYALASLADREAQEAELAAALQRCLKGLPPCPLVCFLHGDKSQGHHIFIERLQRRSLRHLLGLRPDQADPKDYRLKWPLRVKKLAEVPERLRGQLARQVLNQYGADLATINHHLYQQSAVIIHTSCSAEDFQAHNFAVLEQFLKFWQTWPDLGIEQKLMICVSIKCQMRCQPNTDRGLKWLIGMVQNFWRRRRLKVINRRIGAKLDQLGDFQGFDRLYGVVLPELTDIGREEVVDWAWEVGKQEMGDEDRVSRLIDAINQMFQERKPQQQMEQICMDELMNQLPRKLERLWEGKHP
jgi:uncharacterized protein Usg